MTTKVRVEEINVPHYFLRPAYTNETCNASVCCNRRALVAVDGPSRDYKMYEKCLRYFVEFAKEVCKDFEAA